MPSFAVASTMKNEAPYILEWLAHYKALGFDDIVVATNDCSDGTVRMLRRLEEAGHVRVHRTMVRSGGIHRSALRQISRYEEIRNADWVFVCDVDEFLNIHVGDGTVQDLVAVSGEDADVVSVPWRIFGPNGVSALEDMPVTRQFTRAEAPFDAEARPLTGKFVKSLYRNSDRIGRMGLHAPIPQDHAVADFKWVLPGGADYVVNGQRTDTPPVFDVAQVNHYALRSLDSYLVKRDRGRANHSHHVLGLEYWQRFNLGDEEDLTVRRYDDAVAAFVEAFRTDFRLARLHEAAVAWHRDKAAALRRQAELGEMIAAMEAML
ncbi:MAG: glycosyltransferase family 2 protein [Paracoccaceae bacterium]|nr:glycosyltransferase family 2 protein [Paracoccaceae bacterium]